MDIVGKIKKLQLERNWTDYRLAQESESMHSTIATMYQRGTPPKIELLQRICEAYGITLAQFFLEDEHYEILSDKEKKMLEAFRRLPAQKQQALIDLFYD